MFGSVLAEQIGVPLPAIPVLLAAGALAGSDRLNLGIILAVSGVASLIADTFWYWVGRKGGAKVLGWMCRISLEPDSCVRKTQGALGTHGARTLLFAKFVPGLSTVAPPLAGIVKMPLREFLIYSGIGGVVWAGAFAMVGWAFSHQLEQVGAYVAHLGGWRIAILVAAAVGYVGYKFIGRRRFLRKIRVARISPEELKSRLDRGDDLMVVDVRDRLDFDAEPAIIPGALHLSIDELEARHREIPREREIVLYCT